MDSNASSTGEPRWVSEVERLAALVDRLTAETLRLRTENKKLADSVRDLEKRTTKGADTRVRTLEAERQAWIRQRQTVADRIEVLLGKFQWLEQQQQDRTTASVTDH